MMILLLLVLLLPTLSKGQLTLEPVRLPDPYGESFYYPDLGLDSQHRLRCVWASLSDTIIAAYAQTVQPNGQFAGEAELYDSSTPEHMVCPAKLTLASQSGGGEVRLIFHS